MKKLFLLLCIFPSIGFAQDTIVPSIDLILLERTGNPVVGCRVLMNVENENKDHRSVTDEQGRVSFLIQPKEGEVVSFFCHCSSRQRFTASTKIQLEPGQMKYLYTVQL